MAAEVARPDSAPYTAVHLTGVGMVDGPERRFASSRMTSRRPTIPTRPAAGTKRKTRTAPRQPHANASAGRIRPPRKVPSWTPDCLMPVTIPRDPDTTLSTISVFVAGLAQPLGIPETRPANTSHQYDGARLIAPRAMAPSTKTPIIDLTAPRRSVARPSVGERAPATIATAVMRVPICHRLRSNSEMKVAARTLKMTIGNVATAIALAVTALRPAREKGRIGRQLRRCPPQQLSGGSAG